MDFNQFDTPKFNYEETKEGIVYNGLMGDTSMQLNTSMHLNTAMQSNTLFHHLANRASIPSHSDDTMSVYSYKSEMTNTDDRQKTYSHDKSSLEKHYSHNKTHLEKTYNHLDIDDYSRYWKNLDTSLLYVHPSFQYKESIIITDLYECLVKKIVPSKFYDIYNTNDIEIFDDDFIKTLYKSESSIIIISNITNTSKLTIDMLKKVMKRFYDYTKIPLMGLFVLIENCMSKPHTGGFAFVKGYYKRNGANIKSAIVVSNNGGMLQEKTHQNGYVVNHVAYSDIDRCFAHNINCDFYTIDEYIKLICGDVNDPTYGKKYKYMWNNEIISPEMRQQICNTIQSLPKVNILERLNKMKHRDSYLIMIMGPPRCGKTKLAQTLVRKWESSSMGEHNAVVHLSREQYTKSSIYRKFVTSVDQRISIIIDGHCDNRSMRKAYLNHIKDKNVGVLFIEINIGLEMSKVLNHYHVQMSKNESEVLYKPKDFHIYKSIYERPSPEECGHGCFIFYAPVIEQSQEIMNFRY